MRKIADIFLVSFIAMVAVMPAHAEIVSTERLDTRLGTEGNLATVAKTGSYDDLSNKPEIGTIPENSTVMGEVGKKQDASTAVTHPENTAVGSPLVPVYINEDGVATVVDVSNMVVGLAKEAKSAGYANYAENAKKICNGPKCLDYVEIWVE